MIKANKEYVKCCFICDRKFEYFNEVDHRTMTLRICQHSMRKITDEQQVCRHFTPATQTQCCFVCMFRHKIRLSYDNDTTHCKLSKNMVLENGVCNKFITNKLLLHGNKVRIKLQDKDGYLQIKNNYDMNIIINFMVNYSSPYLLEWNNTKYSYRVGYRGGSSFFWWKFSIVNFELIQDNKDIIEVVEFKKRLLDDNDIRLSFRNGKAQFSDFT